MPAVTLFSRPAISYNGQIFSSPKGKTSALLYYLAFHNQWVHREDILLLLWPDTQESKARTNLRQLLRALKQLPYYESLDITAEQLRWSTQTDVHAFKSLISEHKHLEAFDLYKGHLLQEVRMDKLPEFQSWLEYERSHLFLEFKSAILHEAKQQSNNNNHAQAALLLEKLYTFDSYDEECLQLLLSALSSAEQKQKAVSLYKQFEQQLQLEFSMEPSIESKMLFEQLKHSNQKTLTLMKHFKLPNYPNAFIGRTAELGELQDYLHNESCRLLTLLASGGMGKTRLATQLAKQLTGFTDGVCFVALEAAQSAEQILQLIIEALHLNQLKQGNPKGFLLKYLETKKLILILDNFEHLLKYTSIITDLLENTSIKILVTSRERLNLHSEWLFDLSGLKHKRDKEHLTEAEELFVQTAKKAQPSFEFAVQNQENIQDICQLLGGMPLAIELAASLIRILSTQEILAELKENLDILHVSVTDLPERHLSINGIFESSWQQLNKQEQTALSKLSVFEAEFTKEAAFEVTNVSLVYLLLLMNKSFLRQSKSRRFTPHPLVWQFIRKKAKAQLNHEPLEAKHAQYYLQLMQDYEAFGRKTKAKNIRKEINKELPNVRKAWSHATKEKQEAQLGLADLNLFFFFLSEARYKEGAAFFKEASQTLKSESLIHARVLHRFGALLNFSGDSDVARLALERSLALKRRHGSTWDTAHALLSLNFSYFHSDFVATELLSRRWEECAELFALTKDALLQGRALSHQAEFTTAAMQRSSLLLEANELLLKEEGYHELSANLRLLALHKAFTFGDLEGALRLLDESISLEKRHGNTRNLATRLMSQLELFVFWDDPISARDLILEILVLEGASDAIYLFATSYGVFLDFEAKEFVSDFSSIEQRVPLGNPISDHMSRILLSKMALASGELQKASFFAFEAKKGFNAIKAKNFLIAWDACLALIQCAVVSLEVEDFRGSVSFACDALKLAGKWGFLPLKLATLAIFSYLLTDKQLSIGLIKVVLESDAALPSSVDLAKKRLTSLKEQHGAISINNEDKSIEQLISVLLKEESNTSFWQT